jgi:peroxiredoxin
MKTTLFPANLQWFGFTALLTMLPAGAAETSLKVQLEARAKESATKSPEATQTAYAAGIKAVEESGVVKAAKQVGDPAPDFSLKNADGKTVALKDLLKKGPVVLTWYRGGWCPYCNITLRALQKVLPEVHAAGAQLVALTPELPGKTAETTGKNELKFEVLTDLNHAAAREYGLIFKLTPEVRDLYRKHFDLTEFNGAGAGNDQLPLAATYIIGQDGVIRYAFLHADYRERAEPAGIVSFLKEHQTLLSTKP